MFMVLFWIILHLSTCLLYLYCRDEPRYRNGKVYDLRMPAVTDLDRSCHRYTVSLYVENVIAPANKYYDLQTELQYDNDWDLIQKVLIQISSFIHIPISLDNFLERFPFFREHHYIVVIIIFATIILCVFLCFAIAVLYEAKLTIRQYSLSPKELKDIFMESPEHEEFPVSEHQAFNNFVILRYYSYLTDLKSSIKRRRSLLVCLSALAIVSLIITAVYASIVGATK